MAINRKPYSKVSTPTGGGTPGKIAILDKIAVLGNNAAPGKITAPGKIAVLGNKIKVWQ